MAHITIPRAMTDAAARAAKPAIDMEQSITGKWQIAKRKIPLSYKIAGAFICAGVLSGGVAAYLATKQTTPPASAFDNITRVPDTCKDYNNPGIGTKIYYLLKSGRPQATPAMLAKCDAFRVK